jgi:uncharacterized protein (DUF169 family)
MDNTFIARELTAILRLGAPPIGIAFADSAPQGVRSLDRAEPSPCTFWRRAEAGQFFASAEHHFNCPVGAMVMGFSLPESVQQNLGAVVGNMMQCGYIGANEPAHIPTMRTGTTGIVYGPLQALGVEPNLILAWVTPRQAMLWSEASGACSWDTASNGHPEKLLGRPGCAALPVATNSRRPTLSLGCAGMRTFTEMNDHLLGVVPGSAAGDFVAALRKFADANRSMESLYQQAKAAV